MESDSGLHKVIELNYLESIRRNDMDYVKELSDRVFFHNYYLISKKKSVSLSTVLKMIGREKDESTIINHFRRWTNGNNNVFVYVACMEPEKKIIKNHDEQIMFDFAMRDCETGRIKLVGGILFSRDDKVSFHT